MRIGYVDRSTAHPHSLAWWAHNGQDPATTLHLIRSWAWSPWAQEAQQRLGHALHEQTPLPHRLKELAIVRVCSRAHSPYELFHHLPLAENAGLTAERLEAVQARDGTSSETLKADERAALRYVDEFDEGRGVDDETFAELLEHLSPPQVIALSLQAGYWACNARLTVALRVEQEPWLVDAYDHAAGETGAPISESPIVEGEGPGRLGAPPVNFLPKRSLQWLDRWTGGVEGAPLLARAWTWVPDAHVAEQRLWSTLLGSNVDLDPRSRALVVIRTAWLRHSDYLMKLLRAGARSNGIHESEWSALTGDTAAFDNLPDRDRALIRFIDAWDTGLGVSNTTFATAFGHLGRRQIVEAQLLCGFFATQARLATALRLPSIAHDDVTPTIAG